jgi:hypothetical protein
MGYWARDYLVFIFDDSFLALITQHSSLTFAREIIPY